MGQGDVAQAALVEQTYLGGGGARGGQAIVEAFGQRARVTVAGFVEVFAGFVAGHQFQHTQGQVGAAAVQHAGGVEGELAPRGLGGEEEHLVQLLRGQGFEQREDRANGLADAGGRLGHQAAAGGDGLVHRLGQGALAGAEFGVGETQALRRAVAGIAVLHFLLGPAEEQRALPVEERLQLRRLGTLAEHGLAFADDIEVHQRQVDLGQPKFLAHQPAIHFDLSPV